MNSLNLSPLTLPTKIEASSVMVMLREARGTPGEKELNAV